MTRWIPLAALPLLISCSFTHSADDFETCDEQCDDPVEEWAFVALCDPATIEQVKECHGDIICVGARLALVPRECSACVFNQYIVCGRQEGCRCEWESYNCCREAAGCAPGDMECPACNVQGNVLLGCLPRIADACEDALEVCQRPI